MAEETLTLAAMLQRINALADQEYGYTSRNMVDWPAVGAKFKAERLRLGLTQEQVAAKGGADQSAISKIERADTHVYMVTFAKAVDGLGLSVGDFLKGLEKPLLNAGDNGKNVPVLDTTNAAIAPLSAAPSQSSATDVRTLILDLVVALQRVLALDDARQQRRTDAPAKIDRDTSGRRKIKARTNPRTGT